MEDTYSIVIEKLQAGKTMCSLCSRLRRGILYRTAGEIGATKIALGRRNIVIRPLAYCREKDLARYAHFRQYPCNLCGTQTNLQRVQIKKMLMEWEKDSPNRVGNIFRSMQRVTRSHMLDTDLYDFAKMTVASADELPELDIAFDPQTDLDADTLHG